MSFGGSESTTVDSHRQHKCNYVVRVAEAKDLITRSFRFQDSMM